MSRLHAFTTVTLVFALSGSIASAADTAAATGSWSVDPVHSSAEFTVKHLVVSNVKGVIPIKQASVSTAGASLMPVRIDATLDAAAVDTRDTDRDSDLRGGDWFETSKYPTIAFTSTRVDAGSDAQSFRATGNLTLHGVTKTVVLDGKILGKTTDGHGRQRVAYSAATSLDRRDFGMNFLGTTPGGALIAGNDVAIDLEIEAVAKP